MTTVYDLSPGQAWDPAESRKGPLRDKPVLQHASETEQYSEDSRLYLEDVGRSCKVGSMWKDTHTHIYIIYIYIIYQLISSPCHSLSFQDPELNAVQLHLASWGPMLGSLAWPLESRTLDVSKYAASMCLQKPFV